MTIYFLKILQAFKSNFKLEGIREIWRVVKNYNILNMDFCHVGTRFLCSHSSFFNTEKLYKSEIVVFVTCFSNKNS